MSVLIKNGRVITATDDFFADIYIQDDKVMAIGKDLNFDADTIIDAAGKLVMPGGIDPHVHLEMPFMGTSSSDTYETGTELHFLAEQQQSLILFFKNKAIAYNLH